MNLPSCQPVTFVAPDQLQLQGLLFGNIQANRAYLGIHGLTANAFSRLAMVAPLADESTQVLTFSNRGHDKIAYFKRIDPENPKGYTSETIGEAHEVFSDCVHDIQGAINFLESKGVEDIYLVGHSTGCQKAVYYLSQISPASVKGTILLCPMSDYAYAKANIDPATLIKATNAAKKMVEEGKAHNLLPLDVWPQMHAAQRFLSLFTPHSDEEIFSYSQTEKVPTILQKISVPIKIILAGEDEARDRPMTEIAGWFNEKLKNNKATITIIDGATHNLKGHEEEVRGLLKDSQ